MCLLCKLLNMISSGSSNNNEIRKYRPTPRPKECEVCHTPSTTLCIFNTAILCEHCFVIMAERFPHVVLKSKGVRK